MQRKTTVALIVLALFLGFGIGNLAAPKKIPITPDLWEGKTPEEATGSILEVAVTLAGTGTWENINVGRIHYLSGEKEEGKAIFDRYTGASAKPGDLVRVARVYAQAGEWDKASPLYDRVLALKPTDEDWLTEAGAWYNLNGDREQAEKLFARSFAASPRTLRNALAAAGSYVGVEPRRR